MDGDTIFALSSGPPPAGVAVIRLSGPGARFGLETLIDSIPEPRNATLRLIKSEDGQILDQGLVLFFPAPASFTGEDVAELHVHGGRAVIAAVLRVLGRLDGFRPAEAGEFTRRAFLNRRMDLTQVEGLADLVAAETEAQRRQALRQVEGGLRHLYEAWRRRLVRARAMLEAELDFAEEEDLPASVASEAWREIAILEAEITAHLDDQGRGERLRDGAEIVILGAPNAGKSSLLNALARRDIAIVTAEPGTTRDLIELRLDLDGFPVTLVDTAGLRETTGMVESEGIRRARARADAADLILFLSDVSQRDTDSEPVLTGGPPGGPPVWRIGSKRDLIDSGEEQSALAGRFDALISVRTGEGVPALLDRLADFARDRLDPGESPLLTRERHRATLMACLAALAGAKAATEAELTAEELRRASDTLSRITGRIDVEDLLDVIFREFCIGK